jgi:hypothetical protein
MLHHHAQLIAGNHKAYEFLLKKIEQDLGLGKTHPDLMAFSYIDQKLGVEEASLIRDALIRNPVNAPQIVVVIYAHTLTEQAQNALLKICEEPPKQSYIFLVTDFLPHLIPTLRSRFVAYELGEREAVVMEIGDDKKKTKIQELMSAETFLKSSIEARLGIAKDIHTALDKETLGIGQVWDFANQIEKAIHQRLITSPAVAGTTPQDHESQEKMRDALDVLNRTQQYMHAPGNSVKMLLEYLAVRL